ncbi:protein saal1 [Antennarius striatus]|uniref:protein saal1 n=1 Tax=Antennarius striatus TaxID=241820 RepID=UPI0035B329F3
MDSGAESTEEVEGERSSPPTGLQSPLMARNPSPPPDTADGEEEENLDAIGETVYSKHWLFSTLTRLIHMVSEHSELDAEGEMQLPDEDEEDLCRVWDMAMDKDVAGFLQEFKATEILLGVIAKSRCPRLTEICVGILGNIACFPETCLTLSQNEDLCAVLLLLLGDADPPTLLETSRLLLTCVCQKDVSAVWLQRIRQQPSVCSSLCFIMCSSTNTDLLEKVGELVENLFDLDEELMRSWVTAQPSEEEEKDEGEGHLNVASCLLEAAKQLRSESLKGLEIYLHALQLLTTIDEGIEVLSSPEGPSKAIWDFVCDVVCKDFCQPDDLPVVLQEQKTVLLQAFAVLHALYRCQNQWGSQSDTSLPLIGSILRVLHFHTEGKHPASSKDDRKDDQLQALAEITAEFLSDICIQISKDTVEDLVKTGYLTEKTSLIAASSLVPDYKMAFQHLQSMLSKADPQMADMVRKQFPV